MFATGQCLCGAVRYEVAAPPLRMAQCHCEDCRRLTGTGHLVQAFFNRSDVSIFGQTSSFENYADSGNLRRRHFCPTCGSRLFSENDRAPDIVGITAGTFDDSSWFAPSVALYVGQRPAWDPIDPTIQTRERM